MPSPAATAVRRVVAALPVERGLQRVLDGQRPALDEEQVRQRGVAEHARERLDEVREVRRVDVGVRRLVDGHLDQLGHEVGVVDQRRVVHAQWRGGEEAEQVEMAGAVARVDEPGPTAGVGVQHEVESVDEQVTAERLVDAVRCHGHELQCRRCGMPRSRRLASDIGGRSATMSAVRPDESSARRAGPPPARPARGRRPGDDVRARAGRRAVAHGGARARPAAGADRGDPRLPGRRRAARPLASPPTAPGWVW